MPRRVFIGTAGWSVPRASAFRCPDSGTHLERYARAFPCAEINSSFHRPHSAATYAKWAACTPPGFRFAVKVSRVITHDLQLKRTRRELERFLDETAGLGKKRGPLLVQLPPSHAFDRRVVGRFFTLLRERYRGPIVCEPRHEAWFSSAATDLFIAHRVARVAADPSPVPGGDRPGGWNGIVYYRLHGSPRKYWSRYEAGFLARITDEIAALPNSTDAWCLFDNTASGAAFENAWELRSPAPSTVSSEPIPSP